MIEATYLFLCVCVCEGARACVCIGTLKATLKRAVAYTETKQTLVWPHIMQSTYPIFIHLKILPLVGLHYTLYS